MDEAPETQVEHDVRYLERLARDALELSTAGGRRECAEAAKSEDGRAMLQAVLAANVMWRQAMATTVVALDEANTLICGALAGDPIDQSAVH